MRQDATQGENTLWQAIRNKQLGGLKFKRQFPLENCILDFVCLEARLIIELMLLSKGCLPTQISSAICISHV